MRPICVRVEFDPPPIPIRTSDWRAWDDEDGEAGVSYGATRAEAIQNLLDDREEM